MKVLRLSPDLAIVPSMVQSVSVHGFPMHAPDYYTVAVVYLFGAEQIVGTFYPAMEAKFDVDRYKAELAACEARAHAVYEQIIQAVEDEAA